jgi:hypothetical protein
MTRHAGDKALRVPESDAAKDLGTRKASSPA